MYVPSFIKMSNSFRVLLRKWNHLLPFSSETEVKISEIDIKYITNAGGTLIAKGTSKPYVFKVISHCFRVLPSKRNGRSRFLYLPPTLLRQGIKVYSLSTGSQSWRVTSDIWLLNHGNVILGNAATRLSLDARIPWSWVWIPHFTRLGALVYQHHAVCHVSETPVELPRCDNYS